MTRTATNDRPRKINQRDIPDALIGQDPFDGSNIRGRRDVDPTREEVGRLPLAWRQTFRDVLGHHQFVVWSFQTPIAWVTQHGEIVVPNVHYSATTTKQQKRCLEHLRTRDGQRGTLIAWTPEASAVVTEA